MGLITKPQLYMRVNNELRKGGLTDSFTYPQGKAQTFLNESKESQKLFSLDFDIFLSHSSEDVVEVIGLKLLIEDLGYSVYIDWINDPELDRANVTKRNAGILRDRMNQCSTLLYAFSDNSSSSTWMPWELGYFDGLKGLVAVLPVSNDAKAEFKGNEYLGLYPYIDFATPRNEESDVMWVNETTDTYVMYKDWITGRKPFKRV